MPTWTTWRRWPRPRCPLRETRIIAVGRIGAGPEQALFARYAARLIPPPVVAEIADARGSALEIKRREAVGLLAAIPPGAWAVALDLGGRVTGSEALTAQLTGWRDAGRSLAFVIGGAEGLDASVLARADHALSLGALTWPHLLVRVMLAEQLFRAQAIASGHPYHRAGRP